MITRRITLLRRAVQTLCFAAIVYGGFLFVRPLEHGRSEIIDGSGYAGKYEIGRGVRLVEREKPVVSLNLPATSCYYQHRALFSGCSLAYISEHLTWLTPLLYIVPQLLLLLALMFVAGRLWCGWVCPFGFLSDLLGPLRRLFGLDHLQLSRRWREGLVWTKYVLLAATLVTSLVAALPALASSKNDLLLSFCQLCLGKFVAPFFTGAAICWTNFQNGVTATLTVLGLIVFALFFLGLFVRRIYCRICPVGGLTAPFNRYGLVSLQKIAQKCTHCGACARVCPVDNLTVLEGRRDGPVDACECTLCLRCVEACPEADCLSFTFVGRRVTASTSIESR